MKVRAMFMVIAGGLLAGPDTRTDSPTRLIYAFKFKRRIYQWNVPDRLNFPEQ